MSHPKVIKLNRMTRDERSINALLYPEKDFYRPKTRGECVDMPRPCPYVGCRYHLYLDVDDRSGSLRINYPDKEPWELENSCALDIANSDNNLEEVGAIMGITRERVRQVEKVALARMKAAVDKEASDV